MDNEQNNLIQNQEEQSFGPNFNRGNTFNQSEINNASNQQEPVTIPTSRIQQPPQLSIPKDETTPVAQETAQGIISSIQPQIEQAQTQQSELQRLTQESQLRQQDAQNQQRLLADTIGEDDRQFFQQQQQNVINPIQNDINNLTNLINAKQQSITRGLINESGRPIPQSFITGRQRQIQLVGSAELADLTGLLQAKQGNLALAQQNVESALEARRMSREANIRKQETLLDLAQQISGKADEERQQELNRIKSEAEALGSQEEEIRKFVLDNAKTLPPEVAISALRNPDTAYEQVIPYLREQIGIDGEIVEIGGKKILIDKNTGQVVSNFEEYQRTESFAGVDPAYETIISSAGGKDPDQAFINSWSKGQLLVSQLESLSSKFNFDENGNTSFADENGSLIEISGGKLGEILSGRVDARNPFNTDAMEIKAILQGIVPNLARGIYGEVGVLTDTDINNYKKTLPNLTQTSDVQQAVFAMTLETVANSMKIQLETQAQAGRDVSQFASTLNEMEQKIGEIMTPIFMENAPEVENMINSGIPSSDIEELLQAGYKPAEIEEYFSLSSESTVDNEGQLQQFMNGIGMVESSNNYQARGPVVQSGMYAGQRALGRYQIMPGNLPSWSQQALGRTVSEEEFMSNPDIQDAIAEDQFVRNFQQYGNWDDVASVWHSGRPLARAQQATDGLTRTPDYVVKVRRQSNFI